MIQYKEALELSILAYLDKKLQLLILKYYKIIKLVLVLDLKI